jgi:hypothetical protein
MPVLLWLGKSHPQTIHETHEKNRPEEGGIRSHPAQA